MNVLSIIWELLVLAVSRPFYKLFGGFFPLGTSSANPIPVSMVRGEMSYLSRLRCACGAGLVFHRTGSFSNPRGGQPLDRYETVCLLGEHWDYLYFDMYRRDHREADEIPVKGYKLEGPWLFDTAPTIRGTSGCVEDFPYSIPDVMRENKTNQGLFGVDFADELEKRLVDHERYVRPESHIRKLRP